MRKYLFGEAFQRRFGAGAAKDPEKGSQGHIQVSFSRILKLKSQATGEKHEFIGVYLSHIWKDNEQEVLDAIKKCGIPKNYMDCILDGKQVVLLFNKDHRDVMEDPNMRNKLFMALKSVGRYTESSIQTLCDNMPIILSTVATDDDVAAAEEAKWRNWRDIVERLQDPEVRKRLLMYQTTGNYSKQFNIGHVLSVNNVTEILSQKPDASFVVDAVTWKNKFHRKIKPGATRIIRTRPYPDKGIPLSLLDRVAREVSNGKWTGYYDALDKTRYSTQVKSAIRTAASKKTSFFYREVVFDVMDTELLPGYPDTWTESIGLIDNLIGVLNKPAEDYVNGNGFELKKGEESPAEEKAAAGDAMRLKTARSFVEWFCKKHNIDTSKFDSYGNSDYIARVAYEYAKMKAPDFGLVKDADIDEVGNMAMAAVCGACGINGEDLKYTSIKLRYSDISQAKAMVVAAIAEEIIPKVMRGIRKDTGRYKDVEDYNQPSYKVGKVSESKGRTYKVVDVLDMLASKYGYTNTFRPEGSDAERRVMDIIREEVMRTVYGRIRKR